MLRIEALKAGYGAGPVLHGIELSLEKARSSRWSGQTGREIDDGAVHLGPGLRRPMAGRILFEGRAIEAQPSAEGFRLGIAHVPEGRQVFAAMTAAENLVLGAHTILRGRAARLDEVCETFPLLRERMGSLAGNLSGGQQQMLAIGRGLMSGLRLLLLDEPSLGLSRLLTAKLFRLVRQLRDKGLTVLLAEQNAGSTLSVADRGHVIENERVPLSGPAAALLGSPEVAERYLGGTGATRGDHGPTELAAGLRACTA